MLAGAGLLGQFLDNSPADHVAGNGTAVVGEIDGIGFIFEQNVILILLLFLFWSVVVFVAC